MSEVKRFRADWRHVVETEFDDAQYVGVADFDRVTAECKALQERLSAADQKEDDQAFQLKDREGSRRDWFERAEAAEKLVEELRAEVTRLDLMGAESDYKYDQRRAQFDRVLAERDALLLRWLGVVLDDNGLEELEQDTNAALSASAEPRIRMVRAHKHTCANVQPGSTSADVCDCGAMADGKPVEVERGSTHGFEQSPNTCRHLERSGVWWREGSITRTGRECNACGSVIEDPAPVERDERAEFEAHRKSMGWCVKRMPGRPDLYEDNYTQGGWTSWQARAALDKSIEGASHE